MRVAVLSRFPAPVLTLTLAAALMCAPGLARAAETESAPEDSVVLTAPGGPVSVSGLYLAGRHAQIERDSGAAADFLLDALEMSPETPELLRRAFAVLAAGGRMTEAFDIAERLQTAEPGAVLTHYVLWLREAADGGWDDAIEHLDAAPDDGIRLYVRPALLAWALAGEGRTEDALEALAPLNEDSGAAALGDLAAAQILEISGRPEDAIERYRAAAAGPNGLSWRLARMLGGALERAGDREAALEVYEQYAGENPDSELLNPDIERFKRGEPAEVLTASPADGAAEALFSIAGALRRQRAAETALVLSRMALFLNPGMDAAQILTAEILDSMGRYAGANAVYASVPENSPLRRAAELRMADNLDLMGDAEAAIAQFEAIAARRPDDPGPLVSMGNVLRRAGRFPEAAEAYSAALERTGEIRPHHWSILYARGIALERAGRWPEAEADFLRALEFNPDQPYVLNYLGYTWVDQGVNLERSKDMIRKAVDLRPSDGAIADSLGWAHYRMEEFEDAVRELERAVKLRPQDAVINDHLGDAFWRVGRHFEARFQWRRALSFEPEEDLDALIRAKMEIGLDAALKAQAEAEAASEAAPAPAPETETEPAPEPEDGPEPDAEGENEGEDG